ncbi:MAG: bifunctional 2-polyprenyl-6-hydroxyphenol methylase/3-demethylubiquinol 3-O-methyltransferase UbiG [Spirochaetes bacterium]|jgi:2-polyprenyl-6-hydroxyphenyl methylase/3-demethylubiquinone-9 3-methyltransferase|nr:bifunctional 2-polyprenyl-6-hydroxyphenol methylase/3-demethylubiquinol 3-O-methyltransferase UbiG [Spirochaetota bacterium]
MKVDNQVYEKLGRSWWDDDVPIFSTIKFFINPVRSGYFRGIIGSMMAPAGIHGSILDVGCGGGFLSEEFAGMGLAVTGIDPSGESVEAAKKHAAASGLDILYVKGAGEALPFGDGSFDFACCCDVLEHVDDPDRVVSEISRVLKPGGVFFYDTINRTFISRIITIKTMQEWKSTSFAVKDAHVWEKFIRPDELFNMMKRHGLENMDHRGISSGSNPFLNYMNIRRAKRGRISYRELGERLRFRISGDTMNSYIGYAVKK